VLDKIYHSANDILFDPKVDLNEFGDSDQDTDFESDDSTNYKASTEEASAEEAEKIKKESMKNYKSVLVSKLVDYFDNIKIDKYVDAVNEEFDEMRKQSDLPKQEFEDEVYDPRTILEESVNMMKDYLETWYSQSILTESIDYTYQAYVQSFLQECRSSTQTQGLLMLKIIPIMYRCRQLYKDKNPILESLISTNNGGKKVKPIEEQKVVEVAEDYVDNMDDLQLEDDLESKNTDLTKSIHLFTKLILTEGIENTQGMPGFGDLGDLLGGMGEGGGDLDMLQSLMG